MTAVDGQRSWLLPRSTAPHLVARRLHRDRTLPLPVRALAAVHSGSRSPGTALLDGAVLLAVSVLLLGGDGWTLAAAAAGCCLLSGRVYRDRDRVVARGVAWWPGVLAGPVLAGALLDLVVTGHPADRVLVAGGAGLLALLALRTACWVVVAVRRQQGKDLVPALVVGDGDRARTLSRTLERHREIGLQVTEHVPPDAVQDPHLLAAAAVEHGARHVFLVPSAGTPAPPALRRALGVPLHVSYVPLVSDALLESRATGRVGGVAVLALGQPLHGPSPMRGKRVADLAGAALLLLLAAPVLAVAALAVRLDDGGPVLYRQQRTGRGGEQFLMTKFRTMRVGAHAEQAALTSYNTSDGLLFKMRDDPRVTRVGRVLRRTGADELPQLLDVLRGRMSLVGPRPLPVEADAFSERDGERHLVRPGMTGLWQVSGGSTLRYREMIDLDLAYVHARTPWLDLQVLLATAGVLLRATLSKAGRAR
ncbi:MAG: sugar transferase [Mycobacteriales bacterium]